MQELGRQKEGWGWPETQRHVSRRPGEASRAGGLGLLPHHILWLLVGSVHGCWWHLLQGMGVGKGTAVIYSGAMWGGTVGRLQHAGGVTWGAGGQSQVAGTKWRMQKASV